MKKVKYLLLFLSFFVISSCGKKDEGVEKMEEQVQEVKVVDEEITSGVVDGYKFVETDEVTDRIKIQMQDGGIMLIVLSNKDTPITIANFKKLVSEHFYDGLVFHRIAKDFMIQGGDPTGTGAGGLPEKIKGEFEQNGVTNHLSHTKGVISMARGGAFDSASSQFFICTSNNYIRSLDGRYASFGKVFAGFDVLDKLNNTELYENTETPVVKPVIKSIRFINIEAS